MLHESTENVSEYHELNFNAELPLDLERYRFSGRGKIPFDIEPGRAVLRPADFEQSEDIGSIVGQIIQINNDKIIPPEIYRYGGTTPNVSYKNVEVAPQGNIYAVSFTRVQDKTEAAYTYLLQPNPADFTQVTPDRLDHIVLARDKEGLFHNAGEYGHMLKESPVERLRKLYVDEGIESLAKAVRHNEDGDNFWDNKNALELLRNSKKRDKQKMLEQYLVVAEYTILPYTEETPKAIEALRKMGVTKFVEVWQTKRAA